MILQPRGGPYHGHGLGHISSVTFSPAAACYIGLGFVAGATKLEGQVIDAVYPLEGDIVAVEVLAPLMFDPKGERQHG